MGYDPALGRFIQPDSIIPDPGSSKGFDRYAYVNNNPINFNDPSGHMFAEDDHDNGYTCKDPKYCYGKYTTAFQIFQVQDLYNLGRSAEEGYSGFTSSGDAGTYINALGAQSPTLENKVTGIAGAIGIANDAMIVGNIAYQKASTPYDQEVTVNFQTVYEGAPYKDAERVVSLTGISITNNSSIQQVMNYAVNIDGSGTHYQNAGSAAPGQSVNFDVGQIDLYYDGVNISVSAYSGCMGPCIQALKPAKFAGYTKFNVSPY